MVWSTSAIHRAICSRSCFGALISRRRSSERRWTATTSAAACGMLATSARPGISSTAICFAVLRHTAFAWRTYSAFVAPLAAVARGEHALSTTAMTTVAIPARPRVVIARRPPPSGGR